MTDEPLQPFLKLLRTHGPIEFLTWRDILSDRLPSGNRLIGWSMGSLYVLDLMVQKRYSAKDIILISGTSSFVSREGHPSGWNPRILQIMKKKLASDPVAVLTDFYRSLLTEGEREKNGNILRKFNQEIPILTELTEQLDSGLAYLLEKDLSQKIQDIKTPILLIHGDKDPICPTASTDYIRSKLDAIAETRILPECGHIPFLTRSDEVLETILTFWNNHD